MLTSRSAYRWATEPSNKVGYHCYTSHVLLTLPVERKIFAGNTDAICALLFLYPPLIRCFNLLFRLLIWCRIRFGRVCRKMFTSWTDKLHDRTCAFHCHIYSTEYTKSHRCAYKDSFGLFTHPVSDAQKDGVRVKYSKSF